MRYLIFLLALLFIVGCEKKEEQEKSEVKKEVITQDSINIIENATKIDSNEDFVKYDMDGNRRVSIVPTGEEETPLTKQIGALATIKTSFEPINKSLITRNLSQNYIVKCSACHDDYANGVVGPSLLDKNTEEIANKIKAYRNLTEVNVLMKYLVSQMDDTEIESLAKEIVELNKEITKGHSNE